ncbi:MAG TPA: Holliday junction branch migration DNA helicase RuvB [Jeotgalicoccus sp.]|uniref:Holliday junction branch migration complex subunit RuvB n=1 Tax=Phocicoccus schoeneichii TaxID=1812261 RepID=A0A6V7RFR5_9BACL|nr:Holliday junction branch migration DNA helicase RuvB [Jeotgalicoccus schoeneichii]GGH48660.1 Holliday junction ATP-dependent DNA helicase RuvB [Jeotgalicoccus schoeneichii]CAD2076629.1 Holliday junction ATP-dependent DNA helicase RuvB [Jeotgalicoccus schoeneichii]HLR38994.1 Holliday junction branch migration DNA helicase RuvB [Jeotgalicoccus sp.]
MDERILNDAQETGEEMVELSLRPIVLSQYIGQDTIKRNLKIFIDAAKMRGEALDHVILHGPPGLGKTTLSNIIAHEMEVNIRTTTGPAIERPGDLAAILSSLEPGDVLFIDEIHRLPRIVEEILYSAMEDFFIDVVIGKGDEARSIRIDLPPFTLVGATTRFGSLSAPLRDRFGVQLRLEYYDIDSLETIINRTADIFDSKIDADSAHELAKRSRGTPRIANRLLRRVRDFSMVKEEKSITLETTNYALNVLEVDGEGLDPVDHKIMQTIIETYGGGPVGLETVAVSIGEEVITLLDVYEPYLIQKGFLERTPRGRKATAKAIDYFEQSFGANNNEY